MPFKKGAPPPSAGKPSPHFKKKFPVEVPTREEINSMMGQCSKLAPTGVRNRALIAVLYRGGLRIKEALDLHPKDVDLDKGEVAILHGKGDRSRTVGIDEGAVSMVDKWKGIRKLELKKRGEPVQGDDALIFCTLKGGRLADAYVRRMLRRIAKGSGYQKRMHPHALRHAFASELQAEGKPVEKIRMLLGHRNIKTTGEYLAHIAPAEAIKASRDREPWNPEG